MSLSLQDPVLAKRRLFHAVALDTGTKEELKALFATLMQQLGRPQLQVKEFPALSGSNVIVADAACRLYALVLHKSTATASYFKATDHATTCATDGTQDVSLKMGTAAQYMLYIWPHGKPFANGITCQGNTTGTGGTGSAANGPDGVALLGAP